MPAKLTLMFLIPEIVSLIIYASVLYFKKVKMTFSAIIYYLCSSFIISNCITLFISAFIGKGRLNIAKIHTSYALKYTCVATLVCIIYSLVLSTQEILLVGYSVKNKDLEKRVGSIDLLRFLFAVIIVIFHGRKNLNSMLPFTSGRFAVEFFFMVSGFLMAQYASRCDSQKVAEVSQSYIIRKWKSLYPEVIISSLLSFLILHVSKMRMDPLALCKDFATSLFQVLLLSGTGIVGYNVNGIMWYLAAMLISMAILFPIAVSKKDMFFNIISPLIALFCIGIYFTYIGKLTYEDEWYGPIPYTLIRSTGDIAVGCVCFNVCRYMNSIKYSRMGQRILALIEWGCYIFCIIWIYKNGGGEMDFFCLLITAVAIAISFSKKSATAGTFQRKTVLWLGKLSLAIYLGHQFWAKSLGKIMRGLSDIYVVISYFVLSALTAITIMTVSSSIRSYMNRNKA